MRAVRFAGTGAAPCSPIPPPARAPSMASPPTSSAATSRPSSTPTSPSPRIQDAHRRLESNQQIGKVVVLPEAEAQAAIDPL